MLAARLIDEDLDDPVIVASPRAASQSATRSRRRLPAPARHQTRPRVRTPEPAQARTASAVGEDGTVVVDEKALEAFGVAQRAGRSRDAAPRAGGARPPGAASTRAIASSLGSAAARPSWSAMTSLPASAPPRPRRLPKAQGAAKVRPRPSRSALRGRQSEMSTATWTEGGAESLRDRVTTSSVSTWYDDFARVRRRRGHRSPRCRPRHGAGAGDKAVAPEPGDGPSEAQGRRLRGGT